MFFQIHCQSRLLDDSVRYMMDNTCLWSLPVENCHLLKRNGPYKIKSVWQLFIASISGAITSWGVIFMTALTTKGLSILPTNGVPKSHRILWCSVNTHLFWYMFLHLKIGSRTIYPMILNILLGGFSATIISEIKPMINTEQAIKHDEKTHD